MATKKSASKNKGETKTTLIKIAEAVGTLAGEISVKKDRFTNLASGAVETVKATIKEIANGKNAPTKVKTTTSKSRTAVGTAKQLKKPASAKASADNVSKKKTAKRASPEDKVVKVASAKSSPARKAAPKKAAATKKAAPAKKVVVSKVGKK